ncbi:MAG TPA: serine O-acetyltransferase [Candidatus Hydrogenedentes bacterium]|jgi:serine O-acetyltransferase|nr:serine O-acetyltransferase [Candidatus Hydrogenedentota bacterium]HPJ98328.1 serine O-acetyltransferase [Candidatus Hydrogenedentota bacterium]
MTAPKTDAIWEAIRNEAAEETRKEPLLANFLYGAVLNHKTFEDALSFILATKLESTTIHAVALRDLIDEALVHDPGIGAAARADIEAVRDRDPACRAYSNPLLFFKGFHAIQSYRIANYYWRAGRESLALFLQGRISQVLAVDIHPAAQIGCGILMDHATGVVIGETAVVEDNVSMLHEVTLGGTGKETGDRHPKVRKGVLIAAGATILGNIEIGEGARIGAGSVVLDDIPPHTTAVGVPARVVGRPRSEQPALDMDHYIVAGFGDGI